MTYFHMEGPHYHWRGVVSLSCSGWEGVGPTRYGRQTNCSACSVALLFALFVVSCPSFDTRSRNVSGRSKLGDDCTASRLNPESTFLNSDSLNVIGSSLTSN